MSVTLDDSSSSQHVCAQLTSSQSVKSVRILKGGPVLQIHTHSVADDTLPTGVYISPLRCLKLMLLKTLILS